MDLFEAIFDRRSIRKFLDKPVEEEKILKIIDAGRWAPSAGNIQDWQFIVVRDKEQRVKLSEACLGQYWISNAQVIIVVCSKTSKLRRIYGDTGKSVYSLMDCLLASENMLLAAHALGLGSCFIPTVDYDSIKRILEIPENVRVYCLIPIGYPAEKPNPPHRWGLDAITFFEKYGKKWVQGKPGAVRPLFLRREDTEFRSVE